MYRHLPAKRWKRIQARIQTGRCQLYVAGHDLPRPTALTPLNHPLHCCHSSDLKCLKAQYNTATISKLKTAPGADRPCADRAAPR